MNKEKVETVETPKKENKISEYNYVPESKINKLNNIVYHGEWYETK